MFDTRLLIFYLCPSLLELGHALPELGLFVPNKWAFGCEKEVDGLQRSARRLGEEAIHEWDLDQTPVSDLPSLKPAEKPSGTHIAEHGGTEDVERFLPDPREHDRHEERATTVANRPACDAKSVAFRT